MKESKFEPKLIRSIIVTIALFMCSGVAAQQYEFCNNWLMNLSFVTGTDRGMEQNLDDNFGWMQNQGYTHLRFFGIYPNGVHCFPSPTLDANGYPNSPYHEPVLTLLVSKAGQHDIVVNFDGWEIIAESNYDTTQLGVGFITEEELAAVVQEVLSLGVNLISEEQFGSGYLQAIQSVSAQNGSIHETTSGLWWQYPDASTIADEQLSSVFSFYPHNQAEVDSGIGLGQQSSFPANLGLLHPFVESAMYFNIPTSIAVGSFGTLETENWKNILRFVQIQHQPDRISIEEQETAMLIWDPSFNFMDYIGSELFSLADQGIGERPIVNLIYDASSIYTPSFIPSWFASHINAAPIVTAAAAMGYRIIATTDSVLPEADMFYVFLAGGADSPDVPPLPDYVIPLLEGSTPVFLHPAFGVPDMNDAVDWIPVREHFGLPPGETQTLIGAIPDTVSFEEYDVLWGGVGLYVPPCIELLPSTLIDTNDASVFLAGDVDGQDIALIIQNGNTWLINSNVIHLEASFILSSLLSGPLNRPAAADIVIADAKGLIFAEYATEVDVDLPWSGQTHVRRFDPQGNSTYDADIDLDGNFSATMARGELVVLVDLIPACCVGDRGNVLLEPDCEPTDQTVDIADLTNLISHLFISYTPYCCLEEVDIAPAIDGGMPDNVVDISDLTALIDHMFISYPPMPSCE